MSTFYSTSSSVHAAWATKGKRHFLQLCCIRIRSEWVSGEGEGEGGRKSLSGNGKREKKRIATATILTSTSPRVTGWLAGWLAFLEAIDDCSHPLSLSLSVTSIIRTFQKRAPFFRCLKSVQKSISQKGTDFRGLKSVRFLNQVSCINLSVRVLIL